MQPPSTPPPATAAQRTERASALIAHVLARFHDTHRAEMPLIGRLARGLPAQGVPPGLPARLQAMCDALEAHMFKEEMRLFPMMEQGGGTLIGRLIEDMHAEHLRHAAEMAELAQALGQLQVPPAAQPQAAALRAAVAKLFDDLALHIAVEDDELFPLFDAPAG